MNSSLSESCSALLENSEDNNQEDSSVSCGQKVKKALRNTCSIKTVKKRLPIIEWLPRYNLILLIQDIIAGVAVGLTAVPQSIAYAIVAGLEPQYGLYSSFIGGFVYLVFGSCKDVTVGPTAILAVMVSKYVKNYSADFAILAAFLSGCVCLLLGILNLGFLVNFISNPVITGFTTAAAMQIASTQLKTLFGLTGNAGTTFVEAIINFVKNIKTIQLWDSVLSIATIIMLILLKEFGRFGSRTDVPGFSRFKNLLWKLNWFITLARNAVVVVTGIVIAYCIKRYMGLQPFDLTGDINAGLPEFKPPPFSTVVGNQTFSFLDMLNTYGPQSIVIPFVSILESVAIAKAFAKGKMLDATQEMIALGFCNIVGSFVQSMPVTGSFTRTAINYASGVQTQAGGIFKGAIVILALSLLTGTFYYIPRATLAGLIVTAMFSMIEFRIYFQLWQHKKSEWCVLMVTTLVCLYSGLEYGIICGMLADAFVLLFKASRPQLRVNSTKVASRPCIVVDLSSNLSYCAADHLSRQVEKAVKKQQDATQTPVVVVVDGNNMQAMDTTIVKNIVGLISNLEKGSHTVYLWNFPPAVRRMCENIAPSTRDKFLQAPNWQDALSDSTHTIEEIRTAS